MNSPYHFLRPEVAAALSRPDFFHVMPGQATRYAYADAILEVAETDPRIVVLDVDVAKSLRTTDFAKNFRSAPSISASLSKT